MDCFPVTCDQLVETVSGWLYLPTGNLFKREQVQPSQDQHCQCALGALVITAPSARLSCRTLSGAVHLGDLYRVRFTSMSRDNSVWFGGRVRADFIAKVFACLVSK
jgi:hypothetical protein